MASGALYRATESVIEEDLQWMTLDQEDMPPEFSSFRTLRQGPLDNLTMADQGLGERTAEDLRAIGRITGYLHELATTGNPEEVMPGTDLAVATVAHLFDDGESVARWMSDVFLKEFEDSVGQETAPDYFIESANRFSPEGLVDESVGVHVYQSGLAGKASSTVVDFRLGRLLGVAYIITAGDVTKKSAAQVLARKLEEKMVRVLLGAS